jgi:iron complex outermembrane recepter protein
MKVVFRCLLSAFLAGLYSNLYAQVIPSAIRGKVLTESHLPAESSTILLLKYVDSSIVSSDIAGKEGLFKFNNVLPGDYLLLVTKIGFNKSYTGPYHVTMGQALTIDDITISSSSKQLNEVTIVSTRPEIEVSPGKITINIPNSLTAIGSSAFEILRGSPGVRVDNSNNISIIGRQSALITIDGKPTNLSGDNLVSVLRSMQSDVIERIELITAGSAKEDASAGGIINIVLKRGNNIGANATITAGAGYGRYYKDNAGIAFNDRTKKFNVFGNYNYSANKTFHDFNIARVIDFNNVISNYNVNYKGVQINNNNTFSLGTDYFISPNQTIGFLVNGSIVNDSYIKDNNLKILNQSALDSTIISNSNVKRHISKENYNLNYNGKLDNSGKTLTANFNYNTFNRASNEYIVNDFYDANGNTYRNPLLLQNLSPSNIHSWISKIDFADPISKTSKLEAGIKYSDVTSNNDLIFGPFINGNYTSDPAFSNHFVYTENVNAAYINYENKFDKINIDAGLRAEQTIAKGNSLTLGHVANSNYTDLFPHVLLTYIKDDKNEFSLSYNRGITRPNYEELNPFLYYTDLYDYRSGNPGLKPEYSNLFELSYNYNKTFTTTLYTHILSNASEFNFYKQNDTSKVNINTNINLGTVYSYGIKFFAPVVFTSWWNANFDVDAAYQRYVSYPANGNLNKGTQDIIFNSEQYFIISKTLIAEISGKYESPSFYGVNQFKAYYNVGAAISKQLFNKRGSIRLNASDIFNTIRDRAFSNYGGLNITTMDKVETQVVRLTFTYRFGKTTLKAVPAHHTGNEEEQGRTKSNN